MQLGIDSAVLDDIEIENATYQKSSCFCCTKMLNKWLEEVSTATWEWLLDAILAVINSAPTGENFVKNIPYLNQELSLKVVITILILTCTVHIY